MKQPVFRSTPLEDSLLAISQEEGASVPLARAGYLEKPLFS